MTFVVYTIQKMKKNGKMVKKNLRKNGQNKVHIYISILMINGADSKNFVFKTKRGAKKKNGPYHRAEKALIRK